MVVEENRARTRGVESILLPNTFIVLETCGQHSWESRRHWNVRDVTR